MDPQLRALLVYVVFIAVGIPCWWFGLSVPRAPLPYERVHQIASTVNQSFPESFAPPIGVKVINCEGGHIDGLLSRVRGLCTLANQCREITNLDLPCSDLDAHDLDEALHRISKPPSSPWFELYVLPEQINPANAPSFDAHPHITIGRHSHGWVYIDTASAESADKLIAAVRALHKFFESAAPYDAESVLLSTTSDGAFRLEYSLIVEDPRSTASDWDVELAMAEYLTPFVERLNHAWSFTVSSHVRLFHSLGPTLRSGSVLGSHELAAVVRSDEWRLTTGPGTLNFVLFVPRQSAVPVTITDDKGNAADGFTLNGWGGVVLYNTPSTPNGKLGVDELREAFLVHGHQLRRLIGLTSDDAKKGFTVLRGPEGLSGWELSLLQSQLKVAAASKAVAQLSSLCRLVSSLSVLPVAPIIASNMNAALDKIEQSLVDASPSSAATAARDGLVLASSCLYHPDMIPQLYMPPDHKAAIYAPFFLPFLVKFVVSSRDVWKCIRRRTAPADAAKTIHVN